MVFINCLLSSRGPYGRIWPPSLRFTTCCKHFPIAYVYLCKTDLCDNVWPNIAFVWIFLRLAWVIFWLFRMNFLLNAWIQIQPVLYLSLCCYSDLLLSQLLTLSVEITECCSLYELLCKSHFSPLSAFGSECVELRLQSVSVQLITAELNSLHQADRDNGTRGRFRVALSLKCKNLQTLTAEVMFWTPHCV